jgi:hypothetical protein
MLALRPRLIPVIATVAVLCLAPTAAASPSYECGDMHVSQLKLSGYSSERLVVSRRVLSCAQGRKLVTAYYTSHEEGKGSGGFRKLGSYNCGGGLSSLRGGVALLCNYYPRSFVAVLELRVRSLPPRHRSATQPSRITTSLPRSSLSSNMSAASSRGKSPTLARSALMPRLMALVARRCLTPRPRSDALRGRASSNSMRRSGVRSHALASMTAVILASSVIGAPVLLTPQRRQQRAKPGGIATRPVSCRPNFATTACCGVHWLVKGKRISAKQPGTIPDPSLQSRSVRRCLETLT